MENPINVVDSGSSSPMPKRKIYLNLFLKISCFLYAMFNTFFWYLLPRRFPLLSRPFIEQQVIVPIIVLVSWGAAISLAWRLQRGITCFHILLGVWAGIGIINIIWFSIFIKSLIMIAGMILLILFGWLKSFNYSDSYPIKGGTAWLAVCFGIVLPFIILFISQAGPAQTIPAEVIPQLGPLSEKTSISDQEQFIKVGNASGTVQVKLNRSRSKFEIITPTGVLTIRPTMNFFSISKTRFWAVMGNRDRSYTVIQRVDKGKYKGADALHAVWSAKSRKSWLKPGELSGEIFIEQRQTEAPSVEIQITTINLVVGANLDLQSPKLYHTPAWIDITCVQCPDYNDMWGGTCERSKT